jgi:hypothetical protein
MDLFPNEQNFDLDESRQRFYHSLKEHHKISNIPKFRCEMLLNADNIAFSEGHNSEVCRFSVILHYGKLIPLSEKRYQFSVRNTK